MSGAGTTTRIQEEHGFSVEDTDEARLLSLPLVRRRVPASFLAGFTVTAIGIAVLHYLLVDNRSGTHTYLVWVAAAVALFYLTLVAAVNRVTIRASAQGFRVSVGPLPWRRSRNFPLGVFRGPYVAERKRRMQPHRTMQVVYDLCMLDGRARSYSLVRSFEDAAAARYAARILQREQPADADPITPPEHQPNGSPG